MMRIIKIGGSLLNHKRLAESVRCWLSLQPASKNVLVVGGGAMVDAIRLVDRRRSLGETTCHWLSIQAMGVAARCVAEQLIEIPLVTRADGIGRSGSAVHGQRSVCVLDIEHFLRYEEPTIAGTCLEPTWRVSSDSIAARLAVALRAGELVLLKSTLPPDGYCPRSGPPSDYVDPYFVQLAEELSVIRMVDLRQETFPEREW